MNDVPGLLKGLHSGDTRSIARCITIVENDLPMSEEILLGMDAQAKIPVIGFTGPPGAGKSTLINAFLNHILKKEPESKIAVLAIDPTSAFNFGSLLGDRLRMSEHFNNESVFIRSAATRGSLGGLSSRTIEITEVLRAAGFNYIIIETVGVGQSEIEIAGLADTTVVVLVPEAGDEIQVLKSGIMEIADIFVVNKADRDGSEGFAKNLLALTHAHSPESWNIPVVKTSASKDEGIEELLTQILLHGKVSLNKRKPSLLFEKAIRLLSAHRMRVVDKNKLSEDLKNAFTLPDFKLYSFVRDFINKNNL
jgi:LAO/AO transport system kinase